MASCETYDVQFLAFCGLLILSLVGPSVCGCSRIIQIYTCNLIGREESLIDRVYLDLLLLPVVICPKIGSGILYLGCIVILLLLLLLILLERLLCPHRILIIGWW